MLEYYYGSSTSSRFCLHKQLKKTYVEAIMIVTAQQLSKWSFKIPAAVIHRRSVEHIAYMVPAYFYSIQRNNDARYLPAAKAPCMLRSSHSRQRNVSFVQIYSTRSLSELKLFDIIVIKDLSNIDRGEDLYASHCTGYTFSKVGSSSESQ